jgi:hypothetical protein
MAAKYQPPKRNKAMWNFNLLAATRTVEATMPFMLYRLAICLGVAFACLFAALIGAGTFIAFASFSAKQGGIANFGASMGLGALAFFLYRYRVGLFFNMKAGHLALLAELARGEKLPQGKPLLDQAIQKASQRFPQASDFHAISQSVRQVLQALPAKKCPYLGQIANKNVAFVLEELAGRLAQTADQALISLCFAAKDTNPWESVRAGLVLQLRHFDWLMKNRMYLLAFEYLGLLVAYAAMLYPVDSVVSMLPVDVGVWRYVFALIFAWSLKSAFLEPIATTALAELYFKLAKQEGGVSEAEVTELESCSEAFRNIVEKAA